MNLEIFNSLINKAKESKIVESFLNELNNYLEENLSKSNLNNETLNKDNELSLLQKIYNSGKVTVEYRDKMLIERRKIIENYANETDSKGTMYYIYNKDTDDNKYHISICEKEKSREVIEADKKELPKGAGVDSVLRKVNGKYILDLEATKEVAKQISEMVDELLDEQTQSLREWRKEGHVYTVAENTGDRIWLIDSTYDNQNGICVEDVEFPKELFDVAKEGTVFRYINGEYVN